MQKLETLDERFDYLSLSGVVGEETFGTDRWINQQFYASRQWRQIRHHVIARDEGCDLGIEGYDIHDRIFIHHMNPMRASHIVKGSPEILDPEFLITVTFNTHNDIHYGNRRHLPRSLVERKPGDHILW